MQRLWMEAGCSNPHFSSTGGKTSQESQAPSQRQAQFGLMLVVVNSHCHLDKLETQLHHGGSHLPTFEQVEGMVGGAIPVVGEEGAPLCTKCDGNCLFREKSLQLYGTEDHFDRLRALAVSTIRSNYQFYQHFFLDDDFTLDSLSRNAVYAGQESILALSQAMDMTIQVTMVNDQGYS